MLYASPNAVSAYRRLGVVSNIVGERLADIGVEPSLAWAALHMGTPLEAEVEVGSTVVLQRAVPFLRGPHRDVVGGMLLVRDVTELRHRERMLARQEAVIQEIHHRVKNNLQTIASLLRLQARRLGSSEARAALEEASAVSRPSPWCTRRCRATPGRLSSSERWAGRSSGWSPTA